MYEGGDPPARRSPGDARPTRPRARTDRANRERDLRQHNGGHRDLQCSVSARQRVVSGARGRDRRHATTSPAESPSPPWTTRPARRLRRPSSTPSAAPKRVAWAVKRPRPGRQAVRLGLPIARRDRRRGCLGDRADAAPANARLGGGGRVDPLGRRVRDPLIGFRRNPLCVPPELGSHRLGDGAD